jgi:DMSO/TMAO reductase YedYZ heme-binding membrane subunit
VTLVAAAGGAKELWYLTRASGAVALILLTAAICVGIASTLGLHGRWWPRFAVRDLHRNLTLVAIVFTILHVVTTVADGYAPIGLKDAVIPFASPYRPVWLGLGAVAFDLLLALVITSLLRARIGMRTWRAVHWLAYASWPVALVHSLGTGSDARNSWLTALGLVCLAAVLVAVAGRLVAGGGPTPIRLAAALTTLAALGALGVWTKTGPLASGWARRAGTPPSLLASTRAGRLFTSAAQVVPAQADPPRSFTSALSGRVVQARASDGLVTVRLLLRLRGGPRGALRVDLRGTPSDGGVALTASGASFVPESTRTVYAGSVVGLEGTRVLADVTDAQGNRLRLDLSLILGDNNAVHGIVTATPVSGDGE